MFGISKNRKEDGGKPLLVVHQDDVDTNSGELSTIYFWYVVYEAVLINL